MKNLSLNLLTNKLQNSKTAIFCLGASFSYLLAGQPTQALAAFKENQEPKGKRQNIGKLIAELDARCGNKSMLDRLKSRSDGKSLLEQTDKNELLGGNDDCPGLFVSSNIYTDSGTTLGANNTNNSVPASCNGFYTQTAGPDKIYQIYIPPVATRTGACTISVDPTGANWDPSIYLLTNCASGTTCGAGRGADSGGSNVTEVVNITATTPGGTYYFFVDSFYASGALSAGTYNLNYNCPAIPTAATVSVGGRVALPGGSGISRVSVTATDSSGQTFYATTNSMGFYKFDNLQAGGTYVFQVSSKKYQFSNPTQVLSVSDNVADLNFDAIE